MDSNKRVCEKCKGKHFYHCAVQVCSNHGRAHSIIMASEMYFHNFLFKPEHVVDGFIFVSYFSQKKHCELRSQLKNRDQIVLYNFTPMEYNTTSKTNSNQYFLFYGRLSAEKGVETLIKAVSKISNVKLKIVGSGPEEKTYKNLTKNLNATNIEFLGYKTGKELHTIIADAKFVVVSSECYENNPMTIVESYTLGTPVIGAHIGGIPEIINEGKTGYTFESGNANDLRKTIQHADSMTSIEYEQMCANAKNFADENFEKEGHYKRLMAFYKQTINNYKK